MVLIPIMVYHSTMKNYHIPVLLDETINYLNVQKDAWYIDCNLGGGGHTAKILESGGNVLAIDLDQDAIKYVAKDYSLNITKNNERLVATSPQLILVQSNFSRIAEIVKEFHITNIRGILFDLGLSSYQLETADRGFSFMSDAQLDMRMDQTFGASAKDLVNGLHEKEMADLIFKLGEEPQSRKIAKSIVTYRGQKPIETTHELSQIILSVIPYRRGKIHPATQVFQALRIAVNDELDSLKDALPAAFSVLEKEGRLAVISFHSLEDRIVKIFFNEQEKDNSAVLLTDKPITASAKEINENSRARSAKLRVLAKKI